ncbi:MAG TPA: large conductance mechanosensitive channel protein MscL [Acidimicrobiales bacterium]|nr:large conductance mechanosensitive channel protein MscL [Acidimicrobiales bacterium]
MLKDFKAFILRGSVVDLAVGIVIGAAFGTVVASFVKNLLTPLVTIPGKVNFSSLKVTVRHSVFSYGQFLNDIISFVIIAAAVFFFVVRPVNTLMARRRTDVETESLTRECPECLSSIPIQARRCAFCTSEVGAAA